VELRTVLDEWATDSWTVVGNLLRPVGKERRRPEQHVVCEAEIVLQSA